VGECDLVRRFQCEKNPIFALDVFRSVKDDFGITDIKLKMFGTVTQLRKIIGYIGKFQLKNVEVNQWNNNYTLLIK